MRRFGDGSGAPALMLHCSLAHSGAWSEVAARLGGVLDMTAMDLPGHGRSPPRDPGRDFHDQATEAARAALPEGAHVVGHSFGATVALRLALEGVAAASLTLIEPVLFAAAREVGAPAHEAHVAAFGPVLRAFEAGDHEGATRRFAATWGDGRPWDGLPEGLRAYQTERIALVFAGGPALDDDAAGLLAPGRLEALGVPTLLIEGARSPEVVAAIQHRLTERLARAHRVVIEGAGHMAPLTHPDAVADAIRAHVEAARRA